MRGCVGGGEKLTKDRWGSAGVVECERPMGGYDGTPDEATRVCESTEVRSAIRSACTAAEIESPFPSASENSLSTRTIDW